MLSFVQRHYKTIISWIFILVSLIGMVRYKLLTEQTNLASYETYFSVFQFIFIASLGYLVVTWLFGIWKQYQQLKNDKNEAELMLLKSKIDPHFFFNTLNNLYGLAMEKSDETPKVILKLSEVMRYTIYEGENDKVTIQEEIDYLEKYIEIHKIRYQKRVDISFEKQIDTPQQECAPLLFIMLLENAVKHGVESQARNAYIKMKLKVDGKQIIFDIENNFKPRESNSKGFGLVNLKRRLQLIYPKKHELRLDTNEDIFRAQLILEL